MSTSTHSAAKQQRGIPLTPGLRCGRDGAHSGEPGQVLTSHRNKFKSTIYGIIYCVTTIQYNAVSDCMYFVLIIRHEKRILTSKVSMLYSKRS
jgi:hypothetical protein